MKVVPQCKEDAGALSRVNASLGWLAEILQCWEVLLMCVKIVGALTPDFNMNTWETCQWVMGAILIWGVGFMLPSSDCGCGFFHVIDFCFCGQVP